MPKLNANTPDKLTLSLKEHYEKVVVPGMMEKFGYKNPMQVPKLEKIVLNMGVGAAAQNKKLIEGAVKDMTAISGQKAQVTKTRKSIAGFKIRDGWPIGCKVTLRRDRMYEFFNRLIAIALPRTRDFRGLSPKGFDSRGNYNFGIKEQIIFPEADFDKVDEVRGMNITITTTARTDEEGLALLRLFKFPLREAPQG